MLVKVLLKTIAFSAYGCLHSASKDIETKHQQAQDAINIFY
jgi:hypothetical protein